MFDNGTLITIIEFQKAFLHVVFVPTFQKDVDMECIHGRQNF
jgi:hypothetical protein